MNYPKNRKSRAPRTIEDILSQYTMDERGCWLWTKSSSSRGYGVVVRDGKLWAAHRLSYTHHVRSIPDGKCVMHHCGVPRCINPHHLYVVTHQHNMDRFGQIRSIAARSDNQVKFRRYASLTPISTVAV